MEIKNYTTKEVAEILCYDEEVIRKKIREDKIKAFKFGKKWLVKEEEIKRIMGERYL